MKIKVMILNLFLCILFISPLLTKEARADAVDYGFLGKTVDSSVNGYMYGYGPTIIYDQSDGMFYLCYCSTGGYNNGVSGWDWLRFVTSSDGRLWSKPKIVVKVSDGANERAACDPSLVYYDAGDGPFYYLFYSGNKENVQTVMFVSRSENIKGPYKKFTERGTWEVDAPDPKIIIQPKHPMPENSGWYGAGQQTVVVRNDTLYSWFTDDTEFYPVHATHIYFSSTTDPTNWSSIIRTNLQGVASIDVKYDPERDEFVAFYLLDRHQNNARLARSYSADGITWGEAEIIAGVDDFPDWANNPGVSGDAQGHLIGHDQTMVVYGAPYDLNATYANHGQPPFSWAYWDLYGSSINAASDAWDDIPWGWQWSGMTENYLFATGDYDGDGAADRAIVDPSTNRWYVISSKKVANDEGISVPGLPWGWHWDIMNETSVLAPGDYDGDGVTDRAVVNMDSMAWYIISSATGRKGVPGIPWGWKFVEMTVGSMVVPGDYDGDGVSDRAIVVPDSMKWFVISSRTGENGASHIPWGVRFAEMTPQSRLIPGDYDGDGTTDAAFVNVTRDDAKWYIVSSETGEKGTPDIPWGWSWDVMHHYLFEPAVGDYDGDGVTDRAAYSGASGVWYVLSGKTGEQGVPGIPWGWKMDGMNNSHNLLLFDFDGDGVTDRTFVNRATSQWYVLYSSPYSIYGDIVSVQTPSLDASISDYVLQQNYPNPFNPSTTIRYSLPKSARVTLVVYNLLGQKVKMLVDARQNSGARMATWDGMNELGVRVPSGVYFYRLMAIDEARTFSDMKKMIVLK